MFCYQTFQGFMRKLFRQRFAGQVCLIVNKCSTRAICGAIDLGPQSFEAQPRHNSRATCRPWSIASHLLSLGQISRFVYNNCGLCLGGVCILTISNNFHAAPSPKSALLAAKREAIRLIPHTKTTLSKSWRRSLYVNEWGETCPGHA